MLKGKFYFLTLFMGEIIDQTLFNFNDQGRDFFLNGYVLTSESKENGVKL